MSMWKRASVEGPGSELRAAARVALQMERSLVEAGEAVLLLLLNMLIQRRHAGRLAEQLLKGNWEQAAKPGAPHQCVGKAA